MAQPFFPLSNSYRGCVTEHRKVKAATPALFNEFTVGSSIMEKERLKFKLELHNQSYNVFFSKTFIFLHYLL